ncbi:uncharacterized protein LOC107425714 [Ziziphus jujuba]|uniref:RING-type E3 ubiquitin transferase n=1 Tax=Ziziphus jujuba TaxID=326968 RepID=A0A6P4A9C9_ZIZJJ|nr:uncharacterized protein LOC107425714 [Ziziphus jujuba]
MATAVTERLNEDGVDDDDGFVVNFEIATVDEIEVEDGDIIIGEYFDEEDDYSFDDEEVITHGTSRTAIKKLKAQSFVNEKEELGNCCVCLEEMWRGKEQLVGLPKSKHIYHENCILQWLENTNSCPVCRTPLED